MNEEQKQAGAASTTSALEYVWSGDEEMFYDDMDTALHDREVGDVIYRGVKREFKASDFVNDHDVDSFMEMVGERAYEEVGEHVGDWPDVSKEAKTELLALLETWADKHCTPHFFGVKDVEKYTITAEDLA